MIYLDCVCPNILICGGKHLRGFVAFFIVNMLKNKFDYNLREETFGATICDLKTNSRYYINNSELSDFYNE